jgi:hypothetical protein
MRGTLTRPAENSIPGHKARHCGTKSRNVSARVKSAVPGPPRRPGAVAHDDTVKIKRQAQEMSLKRNVVLTMKQG